MKQRLDELEKKKIRMENILAGTNAGTWEWNFQTGEEIINERWAEMIGYTTSELSPISIETWKSLVNVDDFVGIQVLLDQVARREKGHYSIEFRMKHKNGSWVWIHSKGIVNSWAEDGRPLWISGIHTEITKRKQAENSMIEEEILLNKMVLFAEDLLSADLEKDTYQRILDNCMYIGKAKYGALTLLDEHTGLFTTVAISGMSDHLKELSKLLGFNPIGREWPKYSVENEAIKDSLISSFPSLCDLAEVVMPKIILKSVEKILDIGQVPVIKVIVNNKIIGDLSLMMPRGKQLGNPSFIEIYSRQVNMFMSRKKAESSLRENERRLIAAQQMAQVGNWELDLKSKKIWASEESFRIYGIDHRTPFLPLTIVQESVLPEYRDQTNQALTDLIVQNASYDIEFKIINTKTKELAFVHSKAMLQINDQGKPEKVIGTIQDITERKRKEEEFEYLSCHDQLTGLYNRRFYEEELLRLDKKGNLPLTIAMGDVNGLKLINDSFGHAVGDELLRKVAELIKKACREDDIIARLGGDEFVVILPNTDALEAENVINRIISLSNSEKIEGINVSISFGTKTKTKMKENIHDLFKSAEDHMYRNKLAESMSIKSKTIDLIMLTLYKRSNRDMLHSQRVSELSEAIAIKMNFTHDDINQIKITGLMHDIGKIGIDQAVINKPLKFSEEEWNEVKRHSEIGYRILSSVNDFSGIAEDVLAHHEWWDGSGYPRGLKGNDISIQARIIAIADAYDAMTTERTYNKVFSEEEAVQEIKHCSGTQFDLGIAKIFVEKVLGKRWQLDTDKGGRL